MTPEAQQLIDDLQALDGPSREMDVRLFNRANKANKLEARPWRGGYAVFSKQGWERPLRTFFTESIDAAMTLIPDGFLFGGIRPINKGEFQCELISKTVVGCYKYGEHKSIPIAIIIAAIKAGEVEREMK